MSELLPTDENLRDPYVLQLIEGLSQQQDDIEDLENAMYAFFRHIQDQIELLNGWMQFDYHYPKIDAYEYNQFVEALGDKGDHARWSDLLERYSAPIRRECGDGCPGCENCWNTDDNASADSSLVKTVKARLSDPQLIDVELDDLVEQGLDE